MRKAIFIVLLAVAGGSEAAGWLAVSKSNVGTSYIDLSSMQRQGNMAKLPILIDLNTSEIFGDKAYLSLLLLREYDCSKGQMRKLSAVAYSRNMATGEIVYSAPEISDWNPVIPSLDMQDILHRACG